MRRNRHNRKKISISIEYMEKCCSAVVCGNMPLYGDAILKGNTIVKEGEHNEDKHKASESVNDEKGEV